MTDSTPLTPGQRAVAQLRLQRVVLQGQGEPNRAERRKAIADAAARSRRLQRAARRSLLEQRTAARTEGPR